MLANPKEGAKLCSTTDATGTVIGAVLEQIVDGHKHSLAFYYKKLSKTEANYSALDRELFAVYPAIKHFRHMLEGTDFIVLTDHKPLEAATFSKITKAISLHRIHITIHE